MSHPSVRREREREREQKNLEVEVRTPERTPFTHKIFTERSFPGQRLGRKGRGFGGGGTLWQITPASAHTHGYQKYPLSLCTNSPNRLFLKLGPFYFASSASTGWRKRNAHPPVVKADFPTFGVGRLSMD